MSETRKRIECTGNARLMRYDSARGTDPIHHGQCSWQPKGQIENHAINKYRKGDMQDSLDVEVRNHQIREETIQVPFGRIAWFIAITLMLQAIGSLVAAYYLDQSSSAELYNIGTWTGLIVFLSGSLMMSQFPSEVPDVIATPYSDHYVPHKREMSYASMAMGAKVMVSGVLWILLCLGAAWVEKIG